MIQLGRLKRLVVTALAVSLIFALTPITSHADVGRKFLSTSDEAAVRRFLSTYSVAPPDQDRLVAKLRRGEVPDSDRGGVTPISQRAITGPVDIVRINSYADGSVAIQTTSNLESAKSKSTGGIPTKSVSGCTYKSGGAYASYWKNCVAKHSTALLTLAFRFDYSNTRSIGGRVDKWCCGEHSSRLGTFSGGISRIEPDVVRYSGVFNYTYDLASVTRWMQVVAVGNTAYTQMN